MKKESQYIVAMILVAALAGGVPWYLKWREDSEIKALLSRPPARATRELRGALKSATEVRIHLEVGDITLPETANRPAFVASALGQPALILQGHDLQNLIAALHVERPGDSQWNPDPYRSSLAIPASAFWVTALEFYAGDRWLADVRVGPYGRYRLRWYAPLVHKGDGPLLPASYDYVVKIAGND